jgi:hypothetical protein
MLLLRRMEKLMSSTASENAFEPFQAMFDAWRGIFNPAPRSLTQPILPDWSFFRVDESNSTAPETERAVVEHESYGKQIGILLDAISLMVKERETSGGSQAPQKRDPVYQAVIDLEERVDKIKSKQAEKRLKKAPADLDLLKRNSPDAYATIVEGLRKALG